MRSLLNKLLGLFGYYLINTKYIQDDLDDLDVYAEIYKHKVKSEQDLIISLYNKHSSLNTHD